MSPLLQTICSSYYKAVRILAIVSHSKGNIFTFPGFKCFPPGKGLSSLSALENLLLLQHGIKSKDIKSVVYIINNYKWLGINDFFPGRVSPV